SYQVENERASRHPAFDAAQPEFDRGGQPDSAEKPLYRPSLLDSPSIAGRGNGPARTVAMQQAQQTHGNRAVQRTIQRFTPPDFGQWASSGPKPYVSNPYGSAPE